MQFAILAVLVIYCFKIGCYPSFGCAEVKRFYLHLHLGWTGHLTSVGLLYVFLGEVSVQVLCPFFNWIVLCRVV